MAEAATVQELRKYLLDRPFIIKNANKDYYVREARSTTGDIVFKIKKTKFSIYKSGFIDYNWIVNVKYEKSEAESDVSIEFADSSKKWFDLIGNTIQFYTK